MDLDAFDFELPEARIALRPIQPRDAARLLVVHGNGALQDRVVRDLPDLLERGDTLVFNDTRVLPAALKGVRPARDGAGSDVAVDANLVVRLSPPRWLALARPGRRLMEGDRILFDGGLRADLALKRAGGEVELEFTLAGAALDAALDAHGAMPLPPYIARRRAADARDRVDYQTRFAGEEAGSVAAPTAGLHFTEALLARIARAELGRETVRLHVGLGTFAPLTDRQIQERRLHDEWRSISDNTAARLNAVRRRGLRVVPVGTTAMRTLESAVDPAGAIRSVAGPTDIFIQPGDPVRATDGLMTNFHLPRSSLFMLVCALMGTDVMQAAYAHAIAEGYRFYSYGDACLLLP